MSTGKIDAALSFLVDRANDAGIVTGTSSGTATVGGSGSAVKVGEITLAPGYWIVVACVGFPPQASGYRDVSQSSSGSFASSRRDTTVGSAGNVSGIYTRVVNTRIWDLSTATGNTKIEVYARQHSGSNMGVQPHVTAIRFMGGG